MADNNALKIFGFEIRRANKKEEDKKLQSIVPRQDDDGAGYVTASGSHYGQYINIDGDDSKDNHQMIMKYRGVSTHPEVDAAIEDIINESISASENEQAVKITLDKVEVSDQIKKGITEEFDNIISMLDFANNGHDMFKRWYIDGRLYHHLVVNESNIKAGIQEIRPIDSAKVRKVKQVKKKKDPITGAMIVESVDEYYDREVKPHVPDSWMDRSKDKIGYEINFTKYFYKFTPLRSLEDISRDLKSLDNEIKQLSLEMTDE